MAKSMTIESRFRILAEPLVDDRARCAARSPGSQAERSSFSGAAGDLCRNTKSSSGYRIARAEGIGRNVELPGDFLTHMRVSSDATGIVRADAFEPGDERISEAPEISGGHWVFSYYVPCAARSRVVAVIALGRGAGGHFYRLRTRLCFDRFRVTSRSRSKTHRCCRSRVRELASSSG